MKKLIVKQVGSPIRRHNKQRLHLKALGLDKMHKERELDDNLIVRGLIRKVSHMVSVSEKE